MSNITPGIPPARGPGAAHPASASSSSAGASGGAQRARRRANAYTIMVAGAARGKTALLRLLVDTVDLAPPRSEAPPPPPYSSPSGSGAPYPAPTSAALARFVAGAARRTARIRTCALEVLPPSENGGDGDGDGEEDERRRGVEALEGEEERERVLLNLVDTPSLDTRDPAALERSLAPVLSFIEARFAESVEDEQKARFGDHHVHLCLYLLDPDTILPTPTSPPPSPSLLPSPLASPTPSPLSLPPSGLQPKTTTATTESGLAPPAPGSASSSAAITDTGALPPLAAASSTVSASGSTSDLAPPSSHANGNAASPSDARTNTGGALSPPAHHARGAQPQQPHSHITTAPVSSSGISAGDKAGITTISGNGSSNSVSASINGNHLYPSGSPNANAPLPSSASSVPAPAHRRPKRNAALPPPPPPHLPALEISAIKALSARTNVLPVLARADTLGPARLRAVKNAVRRDLRACGIGFGIFDFGGEDEVEGGEGERGCGGGGGDEGDSLGVEGSGLKGEGRRTRIPRLPHAVLAPDVYMHGEGVEVLDVWGDEEDEGTSLEALVRRYTYRPPRRSGVNSLEGSSMAMQVDAPEGVDKEKAQEEDTMEAEAFNAPATNGKEVKDEPVEQENENESTLTREPAPAPASEAAPSLKDAGSVPVSKDVNPDSARSPQPSSHNVKREKERNGRERESKLKLGRYVRMYRWGAVDALDPAHCDFVALRQAVFHHMQPLRSYTRDYLFEKFRVDLHHQRQHLAVSAPSSTISTSPAISAPSSAYPSAYPASATSTAPHAFPSLNAYTATAAPSVAASAAGLVEVRLEPSAVSPVVDEREQVGRERVERERERERRGLFPTPVQQYQQHLHQRNASSSGSVHSRSGGGATSPGLVGGVSRGVRGERERDVLRGERERERSTAALPPLAHAAAARQGNAPLPPLSAVAGSARSPIAVQGYASEREFYPGERERGYERERRLDREGEREREREYALRRGRPVPGAREEYVLERGYEYPAPPLPLPPVGRAGYRTREEYGEGYVSEDEKERLDKDYRRERERYRDDPRDRDLDRARRPGTAHSAREREREYERESDSLVARPASSGSIGLGVGIGGVGGGVSGPSSATTSGLSLSAHPSTHASPSSAYPHTPQSSYPQTPAGYAHPLSAHPLSARTDISEYGKGPPPSSGAGAPASAGGGGRMHHMQHHHHGGHSIGRGGGVSSDIEYDREREERLRERERGEKEREGYGLRNASANTGPNTPGQSIGYDYNGRPVVIEEDVHARLRTKKITVACNFCRSRKLKCDGGRPSCSQCIKRSHTCDYKAHARRRGGGRSSQNAQSRQGQHVLELSEGDEDASGDLDAEYEAASGAEDGPGQNGAHARIPEPAVGQGLAARPGSGGSGGLRDSRRNSNVDLMIAETLQSPRSAAREYEKERERERKIRERDHLYVPHPHPNAYGHTNWNGEPYAGRLAPLPFTNVNSSSGGPPPASGPASATSPGGPGPSPIAPRTLTTNMQHLVAASATVSPGTSTGMISLGAGLSPAEQAVAASATGRKRGGPKLSRIASNYGPKVVACNFCRARKTKCDGQHPTCQSCARRSLPCSYVNEGAPGRGRRPAGGAGAYKNTKAESILAYKASKAEQQQKEQAAKSGKSQSKQSSPRGESGSASGSADAEGEGEDGEGEEEESRPSSTSARSVQKRGYADEESEDGAKKRLRVDEEPRRVNISASA